jgi:hypothetical protein
MIIAQEIKLFPETTSILFLGNMIIP